MPDGPYAEKETPDDLAPGGEPVALSTLIEHGVRLEWHEAVVVVRDICQLLHGTDPSEPVPDLRHIWICANGRMAVAPGTAGGRTSTEEPVTTLGRLLLSLVEEVRMPVQLRVVALAAASSTPAYATLDEFSTALAYFERPGGDLPIRPVYSRWHALAAERDAPPALEPPPPMPLAPMSPPAPSPAETLVLATSPPPVAQDVVDLTAPSDALGLFLPEKKVVTVRGRSFRVFPIAAAASVILVLIMILAWSFSDRSRSSPDAAQAPVEETASGTIAQVPPVAEDDNLHAADGPAAARSGAEPGQRGSGPAPVVATRNLVPKAPAAPAASNAQQGNQRPRSSARTEPDLRAAGLAAPSARGASQSAAPAPATPAAASSRQPAIDERLPVPEGEPPDTVYSSSDQDVEPPILVRPNRRIDPPTGNEREEMTVLDLLISESGQVEMIKLAAPARDYREAMLFSAIKTWKFRPGLRDGHPVRYLKRVWLRGS